MSYSCFFLKCGQCELSERLGGNRKCRVGKEVKQLIITSSEKIQKNKGEKKKKKPREEQIIHGQRERFLILKKREF